MPSGIRPSIAGARGSFQGRPGPQPRRLWPVSQVPRPAPRSTPHPSTATRICTELLPESSRVGKLVLLSASNMSTTKYGEATSESMPVLAAIHLHRSRRESPCPKQLSLSPPPAHLSDASSAAASVIIQAVGCVGLLLDSTIIEPGPKRMHRSSGNINHFAGINVDPVEQLFGAVFLNCLLELRAR